jgi:ABC-type proline/glycine betaine transport system permease subunit
LSFGDDFNQSLERVTLPSSLQSLSVGVKFNQSQEQVTLPSCLESLRFGGNPKQSLEGVTLPSSLQIFSASCLSCIISVSASSCSLFD